MKLKMNEITEYAMHYADWDIDEIKQELETTFPNVDTIEIIYCEDNWIQLDVNGKIYNMDCTGELTVDE